MSTSSTPACCRLVRAPMAAAPAPPSAPHRGRAPRARSGGRRPAAAGSARASASALRLWRRAAPGAPRTILRRAQRRRLCEGGCGWAGGAAAGGRVMSATAPCGDRGGHGQWGGGAGAAARRQPMGGRRRRRGGRARGRGRGAGTGGWGRVAPPSLLIPARITAPPPGRGPRRLPGARSPLSRTSEAAGGFPARRRSSPAPPLGICRADAQKPRRGRPPPPSWGSSGGLGSRGVRGRSISHAPRASTPKSPASPISEGSGMSDPLERCRYPF